MIRAALALLVAAALAHTTVKTSANIAHYGGEYHDHRPD
jgi:hypothetical protein